MPVIGNLSGASVAINESDQVESKILRAAIQESLDHAMVDAPGAPRQKTGMDGRIRQEGNVSHRIALCRAISLPIGRVLAIGMLNCHSHIGASMSFAALIREGP